MNSLVVNCSDAEAREVLRDRLLPLSYDQIVDVLARVIKREVALDREVKRLEGELYARRNRRCS